MNLKTRHKKNQLSFANTNVEKYTCHFTHPVSQTGNVTKRPHAGRPRKTTQREDRLISRRARQRPFSTAGALQMLKSTRVTLHTLSYTHK
jgi:Leucine-rich repeat (LRR) protein